MHVCLHGFLVESRYTGRGDKTKNVDETTTNSHDSAVFHAVVQAKDRGREPREHGLELQRGEREQPHVPVLQAHRQLLAGGAGGHRRDGETFVPGVVLVEVELADGGL